MKWRQANCLGSLASARSVWGASDFGNWAW